MLTSDPRNELSHRLELLEVVRQGRVQEPHAQRRRVRVAEFADNGRRRLGRASGSTGGSVTSVTSSGVSRRCQASVFAARASHSRTSAGDTANGAQPSPSSTARLHGSVRATRPYSARSRRPLKAGSLPGTLIRVPGTPANRAVFGSAGTGGGSSPFPQLRALPLNDVSPRALPGMPHGPAGGDKAAAGQKLPDMAMRDYPRLFTMDRIRLMDPNFPGAARIARLTARTHVLIRLKSDIPLKMASPILADGSCLAELSGYGVTVTVRVIGYFIDVEGQEVPEMFCLVTGLLDIEEYPARDLAALYRWRWDGSETALREAKASLNGAGPGTARRAVIAAIRAGRTGYETLTREIGECRTVVDRNRHRARKPESPSSWFRGVRPGDNGLSGAVCCRRRVSYAAKASLMPEARLRTPAVMPASSFQDKRRAVAPSSASPPPRAWFASSASRTSPARAASSPPGA